MQTIPTAEMCLAVTVDDDGTVWLHFRPSGKKALLAMIAVNSMAREKGIVGNSVAAWIGEMRAKALEVRRNSKIK